jgi:hypothetical protein
MAALLSLKRVLSPVCRVVFLLSMDDWGSFR